MGGKCRDPDQPKASYLQLPMAVTPDGKRFFQAGTLAQSSCIFWPKGEPFFEGSNTFEEWLLLVVFLLQDVQTRLEHRDIGAV